MDQTVRKALKTAARLAVRAGRSGDAML